MMKKLIINEGIKGQEAVYEKYIIHNPDLSDRQGYDKDFLNVTVDLPTFNDEVKQRLAVNQDPSRNGESFLDYTNYSVMFNRVFKLPIITAVNVHGPSNELAKYHDGRGTDKWFQDERISIDGDNFQFGNKDYEDSGFHRGHIVRYYDPAWGETEEIRKIAQGDTFYYTNCCPQVRNFNVGSWLQLEDYAMARAIFKDKNLSILAGPLFGNVKEVKRLIVPMDYWKILVYNEGDSIKAIGFLLGQKFAYEKVFEQIYMLQEQKKPTLKESDIDRLFNEKNLKRYVVKISKIEEKTGLSFGLNDYDVNKDRGDKFFQQAFSDLDKELNRMKVLVDIPILEYLETSDDLTYIDSM